MLLSYIIVFLLNELIYFFLFSTLKSNEFIFSSLGFYYCFSCLRYWSYNSSLLHVSYFTALQHDKYVTLIHYTYVWTRLLTQITIIIIIKAIIIITSTSILYIIYHYYHFKTVITITITRNPVTPIMIINITSNALPSNIITAVSRLFIITITTITSPTKKAYARA